MHGPVTATAKRSRSAQPFPVVRETSSAHRHDVRLGGVVLPAERERLDGHVEVEPTALAEVSPRRARSKTSVR